MGNKFEADTGKILDIVINSLYSEREIFVRELILRKLSSTLQMTSTIAFPIPRIFILYD